MPTNDVVEAFIHFSLHSISRNTKKAFLFSQTGKPHAILDLKVVQDAFMKITF